MTSRASINTSFELNEFKPHAALVIVQALFGSLPVTGKVVLAVMPAASLVGFRVGITAIVLIVMQASRSGFWLEERADYSRLAILSLFGVTLNQILYVLGLSLTKASYASLLIITIPIFTLCISVFVGNEKLSGLKIPGVILAAIGIVILLDPGKASFSSSATQGDLLIILNSLSFGIFVATSKDVITRNGTLRSTMWLFLFASVICVPFGLFSLSAVNIVDIPPIIWGFVLYVALIATAGPYVLNAYAISKVDPSIVAVYIYLQPIIGFILAAFFLGENIGVTFVIATILVFTGVFLTTRKRKS